MVLLLSSFTLSSFAQITLINSNMSASTWSWASYSDRPTLTYDSSADRNKFEMTANTPLTVRLTSLATSDVYLNHSYKLSFDIWGHFEDYNFSVVLVTKENLNTESTHYLCEISQNLASSDNTYTTVTIDFSPSYFVGSVNSLALDFIFSRVNGATNVRNLYIKNLVMVDTDNDSSFWNTLWQKLTELKNSITSSFNTLTSNVGGFFTNLWNNISSAFTNLWNNLSTAFSNLTTNIQNFFINLGEDIEEFFDMLKDYILYFQHPVELDEDGVPVDEYGNPIYENIFDIPDFFETIEDWIDTLDDSKADVNSGANQGIQKISLVTGYLNSLTAIPIISILVIFGMVVIVIKKVLG